MPAIAADHDRCMKMCYYNFFGAQLAQQTLRFSKSLLGPCTFLISLMEEECLDVHKANSQTAM